MMVRHDRRSIFLRHFSKVRHLEFPTAWIQCTPRGHEIARAWNNVTQLAASIGRLHTGVAPLTKASFCLPLWSTKECSLALSRSLSSTMRPKSQALSYFDVRHLKNRRNGLGTVQGLRRSCSPGCAGSLHSPFRQPTTIVHDGKVFNNTS